MPFGNPGEWKITAQTLIRQNEWGILFCSSHCFAHLTPKFSTREAYSFHLEVPLGIDAARFMSECVIDHGVWVNTVHE